MIMMMMMMKVMMRMMVVMIMMIVMMMTLMMLTMMMTKMMLTMSLTLIIMLLATFRFPDTAMSVDRAKAIRLRSGCPLRRCYGYELQGASLMYSMVSG